MSQKISLDSQQQRLQSIRSSIQIAKLDLSVANVLLDSVSGYEGAAVRIPYTFMGRGAKFGEPITDANRKYASEREPIGFRMVTSVAVDIWDQWFKVEDVKEENGDKDLNEKVQQILTGLEAKKHLQRATIFERRYGTSIIVLGYDDLQPTDLLEKPLPNVDEEENSGRKGLKIMQLEAYPKTKFAVKEKITIKNVKAGVEPAEKIGWPRYYYVNMGGGVSKVKVHWSRVIHDAPRLDEHKYWGVSVLDPVYDDITCFRNIRWGMAQTIYRVGSGFPVITLHDAAEEDIQRYHDQGKFADLCARTYLVKTEGESIEFKGAAGVALNPSPYYEAILENLSMGSQIPKAVLRGAQAGTLAGSETNLKEYARFISGEQSLVEFVPRELINRLLETGQIETSADQYTVNWVDIFEANDKDRALIELTESMVKKNEMNWKTINELREEEGPPEYNVILPLEQLKAKQQAGFFSKRDKDAVMEPPKLEELLLQDELSKVIGRINRGELDLDGAIELGESIIVKHVERSKNMAIERLRNLTGAPLNVEPPEFKAEREKQLNYYTKLYKNIVKDLFKRREAE